MPLSAPRRLSLVGSLLVALHLCAFVPASAAGASNRFCGGAATPTTPSDLANAVGDQTLEYAVQQPASIVTCAKGYLLAKCGDHESANLVFDKCIAAGYAGAMIWKALLLDEGAGVERDLAKAAELLHRAAVSGDPAYGPIGKMHYATVLHLGRGVEKNEAEAMKWFQAAAAEGNEEAREFIKTGYHTGFRDRSTLGAGTPTAAALAKLSDDNASLAQSRQQSTAIGAPKPARKLVNAPAAAFPLPDTPAQPSSAEAAQVASEVHGQKLERREPALAPTLPVASAGLVLLLVASFIAGILRQKRRGRAKQAGN